jgi:hypothetical protein
MSDLSNPDAVNAQIDAWADLDMDSDFDSVPESSPEPQETQNEREIAKQITDSKDENTDMLDAKADQTSEQESEEVKVQEEQDAGQDRSETEDSEQNSAEEVEVELPEALVQAGLDIQDGVVGKYVKVDGETKFIDLNELGNDYSGQQAIQRRFSEYDKQNKEWKRQVDEVNAYINTFQQKMIDPKSGPVEAMQYLGELSGMPPYEIKENLIQALLPEIERRSHLTEVEIRAEKLEAENKYLQEVRENEFKLRQQEQANLELLQKSMPYREAYGISQDEWQNVASFLKEHPQVTEEQQNDPEFISSVIRHERADNIATEVIPSVDASLLTNEDFYNSLTEEIVNNPEYTTEDVREIIEMAIEESKKQNLTTRLVKKTAKRIVQPNNKQTNSYAEPDALDWDEL